MRIPSFEMPVEDIRRSLQPLRRPLRVAVLRSGNAFNVGAIIRTAHSFLAQELILVGDEPFYERAAMGMQRYESIVLLPDDAALIRWAQERELPLVVFEREAAKADLWRADIPEAAVLVFGSETSGVSPEILAAAHEVVAIPMYGINHSYPVTVAAGIAMAEWTRRHYANR